MQKGLYPLLSVVLQFGFSLEFLLDTGQTRESVGAELEQSWNCTLALIKSSQLDPSVKLLPLFLFNGWD